MKPVIIVLLSLSAAISAVELCPREDRTKFISTLEETCTGALTRLEFQPPPLPDSDVLLPPFKLTEVSDADLDIACQASCGGSYSKWLRDGCDDPYTARSIEVMCLHTSDTKTDDIGPRCRFAFPDAFDSRVMFLNVIANCNFSTPDVCVAEIDGNANSQANNSNFDVCAALGDIADTFGCCYNPIFNDTQFSHFLAGNGLLSDSKLENNISIGMSPAWDLCMIDVPATCVSSALCNGSLTAIVPMIAVIIAIYLAVKE